MEPLLWPLSFPSCLSHQSPILCMPTLPKPRMYNFPLGKERGWSNSISEASHSLGKSSLSAPLREVGKRKELGGCMKKVP